MRIRLVTCALVVIGTSLSAQQPSANQSDAARKRLEYFIGQWKLAGTDTTGDKPVGFSGTQQCEWFETGRLVICRGETTDSSGPLKEIVILGYNPTAGLYTRYNFEGRSGGTAYSTGNVQGKVWQWTGVSPSEPKVRFSWTEDSADVHTMRVEANLKGKFVTLVEGKATRVK